MRTEEIKIYKFDELSDKAKERAIEWYRRAASEWEIPWQEETFDSLKSLIKAAGLSIKDYSLGLYDSWIKVKIPDDVGTLSGARALGWIENNLLSDLRITRAEYLKNRRDYLRYGYRIGRVKSCPFTGCCADDDFIDDLIDNVKSGMPLRDAFNALASTYQRILQAEYDAQNSDENIIDAIVANEYEFTENGDIY